MEDLLEELKFFFRFYVSGTEHVALRPHLPEHGREKS